MKRFQIYLADQQHSTLDKMSKEKGVSLSELIRRILDEKIEKINQVKK